MGDPRDYVLNTRYFPDIGISNSPVATCWAPDKDYLSVCPVPVRLVELIDDLGFARAYGVRQPATYFLEGRGQITVRDHEIILWDLEGSTIVLKYHWLPGLRAACGVRLEQAGAPPDPHGFIRIVVPPEQLTIQLAGGDESNTR